MYKYLVASSLLFGSLAVPLSAEESKNFYFSLGGGFNFASDLDSSFDGDTVTYETDNPFQYSFAIGKEFNDWRLEFNYSAATLSSDTITVVPAGQPAVTAGITPDVEADVKSYMLFGYKDFPNDTKFTTYIGAGLGFSDLKVDAQNIIVAGANIPLEAIDEQLFTFGVKGGVEYEVAENTSLYSEVGYLNYASFEPNEDEEFDSINSFVVSAGLKFNF